MYVTQDGEERQQDGSPEPDLMATTELEEGGEENEEEREFKTDYAMFLSTCALHPAAVVSA